MARPKKPPLPQSTQLISGFIIPTAILVGLSDESRLGPLVAMLLALTLPIIVELYSFLSGRKASYISLAAIIGILLVGAISLFGLSEEWLAARRAAIYIIAGLAVFTLLRFKPTLIERGLGTMIDMELVERTAKAKRTDQAIRRIVKRTAVLLGGFLILLGAWSYLFTVLFITAPTNTSQFNTEYAELRVVSLFAVTLPLLIGMVGLLLYTVSAIEKQTGLTAEQLFRKKPTS